MRKKNDAVLVLFFVVLTPLRLLAAPDGAPPDDSKRLLSYAGHFMEMANRDFQEAVFAYHCQDVFSFMRVGNDQTDSEFPPFWSYFFNHAFLLAGNLRDQRPVFAYYNPYLDTLLLTRWTMKGKEPRIDAADLRVASSFARGTDDIPGLPRWLAASGTSVVTDVLAAEFRQVVARFPIEFPPDSSRRARMKPGPKAANVAEFTMQQAVVGLQSLAAVLAPGNHAAYNPDVDTFWKAMQNNDQAVLTGLMGDKARSLDVLDAQVRKALRPSYALAQPDTALVFFTVPGQPRFYVMAAFSKKGEKKIPAFLIGDFEEKNTN